MVLAARLKYDDDRNLINHLVRIRGVLESDMAAEAALNATPEQLAQMALMIDDLRANVRNHSRYFQIDKQFHNASMLASGNELGRAIVRNMYSEAQATLDSGLEERRVRDLVTRTRRDLRSNPRSRPRARIQGGTGSHWWWLGCTHRRRAATPLRATCP